MKDGDRVPQRICQTGRKTKRRVAYWDVDISIAVHVAVSQLNLLGLDWFGQLGLLNQPVFHDDFSLRNHTKPTLKLISNAQPVPLAALPLVDKELKRLEQSRVLIPVSY
ncbi:unnamed protein product [Hymenolepis diminuta]|uniref:Transposase n=1 Tax=Hymenolepis diminuta TaxID=6216 RepID=A0A0R3SGP8_HYMDI|nr:unnamed protein product [Hymenolepis diminuta]